MSENEAREANEMLSTIKLLIEAFGGLKMRTNEQIRRLENDDSNGIIKRIAKSFHDYGVMEDRFSEDGMPIIEYHNAKFMDIGNGSVIIFKGSELRGRIPAKIASKMDGVVLQVDAMVENERQAYEIIGE